jgi:hypothetical protein
MSLEKRRINQNHKMHTITCARRTSLTHQTYDSPDRQLTRQPHSLQRINDEYLTTQLNSICDQSARGSIEMPRIMNITKPKEPFDRRLTFAHQDRLATSSLSDYKQSYQTEHNYFDMRSSSTGKVDFKRESDLKRRPSNRLQTLERVSSQLDLPSDMQSHLLTQFLLMARM